MSAAGLNILIPFAADSRDTDVWENRFLHSQPDSPGDHSTY